jgi:hypothetical protein
MIDPIADPDFFANSGTWANGATTGDVSLASIKAAMAKAQAMFDAIPKPKFDCLVLLPPEMANVREAFGSHPDYVASTANQVDRIDCVALYEARDEVDRTRIVVTLLRQGKRPALISEGYLLLVNDLFGSFLQLPNPFFV